MSHVEGLHTLVEGAGFEQTASIHEFPLAASLSQASDCSASDLRHFASIKRSVQSKVAEA
jgi:hypothetical protein